MPTKYDLTLSPEADADVPDGDGYYLHQSLLDGAGDSHAFETLSVSMLMDGPFQAGTERHTKRVLGDAEYALRVSITDDAETDALDDLLAPYVKADEQLVVDGTAFDVTDHDRTHESLTDLLANARTASEPEIEVEFKTPTCVVHPRSTVTEMFPHRRSIFPQLAAHWNDVRGSDAPKLALDPFEVGAQVFEKPNAQSYRTYSTLTDIKEADDGGEQPFFRQGYIGTCAYSFRNADTHIIETIVSLAQFAEYAGVGADTHHGCGCVDITVTDRGDGR